jgi:hypothetical protein
MDYSARNNFTFPIVASITSRKDEDVYKEDTDFDPFTGDSRAGKYYGQLKRIRFNSDYYKDLLHDLVEQRIKIKWMLPKDIDHIYLRHLAAEEKIDGEWTAVAKRNDYFDCECYCLLGATVLKLMKILD